VVADHQGGRHQAAVKLIGNLPYSIFPVPRILVVDDRFGSLTSFQARLGMIAVGTRVTSRPPQSGRIEARTGLRMMPTFPRSPLSFRTAGFPRYGWKAGMSGGAFPSITRLSLLPAFTGRYLVCVRRSCTSWSASVIPHSVGPRTRSCTALEGGSPSAPGALALVRVMLSRPVITYSAPSAPPAGTSRFHRMAAYTRCLRCAGAPRRPASGSELSLHIPS
jgi:hypothetical protein